MWSPVMQLAVAVLLGSAYLTAISTNLVADATGSDSCTPPASSSGLSPGCYLKTECPNHSFSAPTWKRDTDGEKNQNAANDKEVCLTKRKADFDTWCSTTVTQMRFIPPHPENLEPGCYFKQASDNGKCGGPLASWTRDPWGEANRQAGTSQQKCKARKSEHDRHCGSNSEWKFVESNENPVAGNLAYKRPTTCSTSLGAHEHTPHVFDHHSYYAVDGLIRGPIHHSCLQTSTNCGEPDPWWTVNLGQDADISSVRVTGRGDCCGNWMDGFDILVDCAVCGTGLMVPQGLTGDFVCNPRLRGSKVTIKVPGRGRILALDEVEVFSDTSDTSCYATERYPFMKACGECAGPGPSQCTKCKDEHAFVPWRRVNGTVSGSCHEFKNATQYLAIPGQGVPNADKQDQFYTKWGTPPQESAQAIPGKFRMWSTSTWAPCDFDTTGAGGLAVVATCRQYKTILCRATNNSSDTSNHTRVCEVKKESRLKSVDAGAGLTPWMKGKCEPIGGKGAGAGGNDFCLKIPAANFAQSNWTTLSNINELCEAQIALL